MSDQNLLHTLLLGGWTIYPLFICSLLTLAVILERLFFGPKKKNVVPEKLYAELRNLLQKKSFDEMLGVCRGQNSALARIAQTTLLNRDKPREQIIHAVEVRGRKESMALLRYTNILGIVAAISPLLGLLGTVSGMIRTFSVIKTQGVGNPAALAGGISEALISTAVGLTIAIPALVFYRYLQNQAKKLSVELEEVALNIIDEVSGR